MKRWLHTIEASAETAHIADDSDIEDIWFIESDDGVENCCIQVKGYEKSMRGRSAMICLKREHNEMYVMTKPNENDYGVPGGGWNEGESPEDAALRELHEETFVDVTNIHRLGTLIEYHEEVQDWVKEHVANPDDWWYGYYSAIFVGKYSGEFIGQVAEEDRETGYHWESVYEVFDRLPGDYQDAIVNYVTTYWDSDLDSEYVDNLLDLIQ